MQRYAAAKAGGTDGSDHGYRMVIETRYKRLATLRKSIKNCFAVQAALVAIFAADQALSAFLKEKGLAQKKKAF
ncbi:hypothetical protein QBZ16_002182 [Prototheca wickerhamii]|uniref:Uncharacterized protein n=1 Tax=Prototheca wickerhamii TaxID=3111 RepID=A0AAD9MJF1_PROWI|nr:hypothetical protein QBZ16_002182 [Prototheca wickerhamii]